MPEFTKDDRNLLIRIGRTLREAIEEEEDVRGSTPRRDRLLRDERDLTTLRRRLEAQQIPPQQAGGASG